MSIFLEITQLENGDIVLREAEEESAEQLEAQLQMEGTDEKDTAANLADISLNSAQNLSEAQHGSTAGSRDPLVRISFSPEVRDMLGGDLVGVAEAMIDAATDYLGGETIEVDADEIEREASPPAPVIH